MANVSHAMEAKSDQLNYVDIGNGEKVITITSVKVTNSDQPVSIFYQDAGDRPYKPSKGMIRLISSAWGEESDDWVGKSIKLYGDPSVKWAGKEVGGLRIRAFSDIDKGGISAYVSISRGVRRKVTVKYLEPVITENDQGWLNAIKKNPDAINQIDDEAYRAKIERLIATK